MLERNDVGVKWLQHVVCLHVHLLCAFKKLECGWTTDPGTKIVANDGFDIS